MKLRLLPEPPPWREPAVDTGDGRRRHRVYEPGDCWYAVGEPGAWDAFADGKPGDDHHQMPLTIAKMHWMARPMIVVLPNGRLWCLHSPTTRGDIGWQIWGELPEVTVSPSIDFQGANGWHGFIRDGVMTEAGRAPPPGAS